MSIALGSRRMEMWVIFQKSCVTTQGSRPPDLTKTIRPELGGELRSLGDRQPRGWGNGPDERNYIK
jgi:hypothetical protein